jgi:hypothetical protein
LSCSCFDDGCGRYQPADQRFLYGPSHLRCSGPGSRCRFRGLFFKIHCPPLKQLEFRGKEISHGDLSKDIPILSQDEIRDLEEVFASMVKDLRSMISDIQKVAGRMEETNRALSSLSEKVLSSSEEIDESAMAIAKGSSNRP